jgi:ribosome-binding protein aMBF1 (putative translation factor)
MADDVTLSRDAYDALVDRAQRAEARADALAKQVAALERAYETAVLERAKARDEGVRIPAAVVDAELDGAHPVRAWRQYRGLSARRLAAASGLSPAYLCEIEAFKKSGSIDAVRNLARVLDAPVVALLPDTPGP